MLVKAQTSNDELLETLRSVLGQTHPARRLNGAAAPWRLNPKCPPAALRADAGC
jgi:hypothetical protein